jgi:microcystin-dependent protein
MHVKNIVFSIIFWVPLVVFSQVGINTTQPHPGAALEIRSFNKGLLMPRINFNDFPIDNPVNSLLVYEINLDRFLYYREDRGGWFKLNPFDASAESNIVVLEEGELSLKNTDLQVKNGQISVEEGSVQVEAPYAFEGYGTVPVGGIIMWSGNLEDLPDNWKLCDGTEYEVHNPGEEGEKQIQTPDLRGRFIVGHGTSDANQGQGSVPASVWHADYQHIRRSGNTRNRTLQPANLPPHHHKARSGGGNGATINITTSGWHSHTGKTIGGSGAIGLRLGGAALLSVTGGTHTHPNSSFSGVVGNGKQWLKSEPIDIRPPYYVLAFIMRIQ